MGQPQNPQPSSPTLAVLADCHIGNFRAFGGPPKAGLNTRGELSLATFRRALTQAQGDGATCLVIAGDLFHQRRPEPAVIAGVLRVLAEDASKLPVIIVPGNHDMLDATAGLGNTACEPLYREATVVREPEWVEPDGLGMALYCVPYQSSEPMSAYLEKLLPTQASIRFGSSPPRVLITHVGVWDDNSPTWCRDAADGIRSSDLLRLMDAGDFEIAFVGNYHKHGEWSDGRGHRIVQVGTLCPGGFYDAGAFPEVGGMAMFDGLVKMAEVAGPRFVQVKAGEVIPTEPEGCSLFVRATKGALTGTEDGGLPAGVTGYEEMPDEPLPQPAGLPQVADAEQAIAAFVASMPLPEDADRSALLTGALDYWRRP